MLHHPDEYILIKGKQSISFGKDRLEAEVAVIHAILEHSTKASTPKTPPTSRHHHICQERPSSCRSKEEAKKKEEARRTDRAYVYLYIPDLKTSQHGGDTILAGLCACLQSK